MRRSALLPCLPAAAVAGCNKMRYAEAATAVTAGKLDARAASQLIDTRFVEEAIRRLGRPSRPTS